jgi:protein MpaA
MPIGPHAALALLAAAATSVPPATTPSASAAIPIGTSVEGRAIEAVHRPDPDGDPSDAATVVVIGVIHGDEQAGLDIVERLQDLPMPDDIELYLIDSMNPDGVAADVRTNANGVDLNRNFPYRWGPIAEPGDWEYAGPEAASEPETQAIVAFLGELRPDLVIWYHQNAFSVAPADGREGVLRSHYAELTGLPMASVTGGTYTGVAAQWARNELASNEPEPGIAFIVELGDTLSADEAGAHAAAVLTVASEDL